LKKKKKNPVFKNYDQLNKVKAANNVKKVSLLEHKSKIIMERLFKVVPSPYLSKVNLIGYKRKVTTKYEQKLNREF